MNRILVVEDEALIAGDIQRTLVKLGYDVPPPVGTGEAALTAAETLKPSLILMDIQLRGKMDGIDAARQIRARFSLPVVYLTSHSDEATLSRAMETHPAGYLLKPFNDRELRTAIEVALHKHELESQLAARERWFATTLRSIGDAVIATDPNEVITFMNGVAERLTGWGNEAIGRPLAEVFRLVDRTGAPVASPIRLALQSSFAVQLPPNTGLVLKTGHQIAVDDSAAPITDDRGAILGGVVVFRDISDRRKLEERLAQTERLASIGTLAAGTAHEINNPLSFVISNVELTREALVTLGGRLRGLRFVEGQADALAQVFEQLAELEEAMRDAHDGAERVRKIVQSMKKFVRSEASPQGIIDLPDVLEAVVKMTDNAVRHHARVRRNFGTTPFVEADDGPLAQVFTNLLINAAQAIGDGRADANEISLTTFTDAVGNAVVEVRDSGSGIRPEVLPRIFDPFFTTKPVGSGTGLGLAICHNIIAGLGGQLGAESPPGGGALFRVTLPPARRKASAAGVLVASKVPPRRGRILVIDDEQHVALAVARVLRGQHDVTVMTDARVALAQIAAGAFFDVIFCDLMMPSVSGMDVYESLAAANPDQAMRMVFMSGGTFSERSTEFLENTANVHIAKPFAVESLRAIARDYVQ